ncbi:sensor histidine kinase [Scopulibacillus darangshiensis]|nr:sensor histidine kinase [Scopulibacillus darangshiensis]
MHRNLRKQKSFLIFLFSALMIILCMSFPVAHESGVLMDLRIAPWLASFLYGGIGVGVLTTVVMVLYRIMLGGGGVYIFLVSYIITVIMLFFTYNKFKDKKYLTKLLFTSGIIIFHSLLVIFFVRMFKDLSFFITSPWFSFGFIVYPVLTNWFVVFIIETMHENDVLSHEVAKSERAHIASQLAASVAHEVRNPMTVIKGFLQLLRSDKQLSDKYQHYLITMELELERATAIITDYLSFAKPGKIKVERFLVKDQLNFVIQTLTSYALLKGVEIRCQDRMDCYIKGSKEKFQQVLLNIVKNGVEASNNNSFIDLETVKRGESVIITIRDYGHGMESEQIAKAGLPFYTTKETGTGLGLMVCYQIIKAMDGRIHIDSKLGRGTCFTIILPSEE